MEGKPVLITAFVQSRTSKKTSKRFKIPTSEIIPTRGFHDERVRQGKIYICQSYQYSTCTFGLHCTDLHVVKAFWELVSVSVDDQLWARVSATPFYGPTLLACPSVAAHPFFKAFSLPSVVVKGTPCLLFWASAHALLYRSSLQQPPLPPMPDYKTCKSPQQPQPSSEYPLESLPILCSHVLPNSCADPNCALLHLDFRTLLFTANVDHPFLLPPGQLISRTCLSATAVSTVGIKGSIPKDLPTFEDIKISPQRGCFDVYFGHLPHEASSAEIASELPRMFPIQPVEKTARVYLDKSGRPMRAFLSFGSSMEAVFISGYIAVADVMLSKSTIPLVSSLGRWVTECASPSSAHSTECSNTPSPVFQPTRTDTFNRPVASTLHLDRAILSMYAYRSTTGHCIDAGSWLTSSEPQLLSRTPSPTAPSSVPSTVDLGCTSRDSLPSAWESCRSSSVSLHVISDIWNPSSAPSSVLCSSDQRENNERQDADMTADLVEPRNRGSRITRYAEEEEEEEADDAEIARLTKNFPSSEEGPGWTRDMQVLRLCHAKLDSLQDTLRGCDAGETQHGSESSVIPKLMYALPYDASSPASSTSPTARNCLSRTQRRRLQRIRAAERLAAAVLDDDENSSLPCSIPSPSVVVPSHGEIRATASQVGCAETAPKRQKSVSFATDLAVVVSPSPLSCAVSSESHSVSLPIHAHHICVSKSSANLYDPLLDDDEEDISTVWDHDALVALCARVSLYCGTNLSELW